jgi:hypothetical protein
MKQCTDVIHRLVKQENDKVKADEWLKWFDGLWKGERNNNRQQK